MAFTATPRTWVTGSNGDTITNLLNLEVRDKFSETSPGIVTTKGDLVVGDALGNLERLAVGTDDQVLVGDSAQTLGVKWAAYPTHTH